MVIQLGVELLIVDDVAAVFQEETGDSVHDPPRFRAIEREDMLNGGSRQRRTNGFILCDSHG
ncbi:hypothetical protein GCM10023346_06360 [Arthrobacter gyeryongensis]|uniref:Uncharacterized protein n=1 Tax=Arthrobacter gyeryongensis TaxID=1650592 RepID=A0ABP9S2J0_9MICC